MEHPQPHLTWPFLLFSPHRPHTSHTPNTPHSMALLLALSSPPDSTLDNSSSICSNVSSLMMHSSPIHTQKYMQPLKHIQKSFPSSLLCLTFSFLYCTYHLLLISLFIIHIVFFSFHPSIHHHHHHLCLSYSDKTLDLFFSLILPRTLPGTELAINKYLLNKQKIWKGYMRHQDTLRQQKRMFTFIQPHAWKQQNCISLWNSL